MKASKYIYIILSISILINTFSFILPISTFAEPISKDKGNELKTFQKQLEDAGKTNPAVKVEEIDENELRKSGITEDGIIYIQNKIKLNNKIGGDMLLKDIMLSGKANQSRFIVGNNSAIGITTRSTSDSYGYSITKAEEYQCMLNAWRCYIAMSTANDARSRANALYNPEIRDGQKGNAFQHGYWNGLMRVNMGSYWAEKFASAHEDYDNNPVEHKNMDLHNNYRGREISYGIWKYVWWKGWYMENPSYQEIEDRIKNSINSNNGIFYWFK